MSSSDSRLPPPPPSSPSSDTDETDGDACCRWWCVSVLAVRADREGSRAVRPPPLPPLALLTLKPYPRLPSKLPPLLSRVIAAAASSVSSA
jgi:hypothetical protein